MKRWIILIIVAVVLVIGAVSLLKFRQRQLDAIRIAPVKAIPVKTGQVRRGIFRSERTYFGVIDSNREAVLRTRISGRVSRIVKREGDRVRRGESLVFLDGVPGDAGGSRAALETALKNLKKSVRDLKKNSDNMKIIYERDKMLFNKRAISRQAMELSENRWKEAKVQLQNVESQMADIQSKLSFFTVQAPFDGLVSAVTVKIGDVVMPSMPLLRLENASPCKIVVSVSSDDLLRFHPGTPARILYEGHELDSKISRVYPSAVPDGTGTVEIRLNKSPFGQPLGSSVEVRLETARLADVLVIPANSVLQGTARSVVFAVKNGVIHTVPVQITAEAQSEMAVKGKLTPGEPVVVGSDSLLMRLSDGLAVISMENSR
ncbi:MAG: efflux RND transporter periplasmic adaptor subunit [Acidobacteria bacterium]|nr:efflux RND transporter periplasmic adaptor subunit [Acidobacteriota bacterium]